MELIRTNGLQTRIVGVVSDTENVNTGVDNGAIRCLENTLNIELLHLLCRHHVFEIVLKDVFTSIFGGTTGSGITTFNCLNENWKTIEQNQFQYMPLSNEHLSPFLKGITVNARNILKRHVKYFRNDYAELIDLSLKFLDVNTEKNFQVPGATNNARWMFRAIYALKCYLFRDYFDFHRDFLRSLRRFCLFISIIYVKFWNQSSNATDAPFNDLEFLKELDSYAVVDPEIAKIASTAMKRHLWYLSDELTPLALFSSKVSAEDKNEMRAVLVHDHGERTANSLRYTDEIRDVQNQKLHSFISDRSCYLLNRLEINTDFLHEDSIDWENNESYRAARDKVNRLIIVVNDSAERGIQMGTKLIDEQRIQSEERFRILS